MIVHTCNTCRFWSGQAADNVAICHRYPAPQQTSKGYWCGEYLPLPEPAPATGPDYGLTTKPEIKGGPDTSISGVLGENPTPEPPTPSQPKPRRRTRRR